MQVETVASQDSQDDSQLLQLPGTVLSIVLQQLDPYSTACTAAACSKLSRAAPAAISKVALTCRTPETLGSFHLCLERHSFTSLAECCISNEYQVPRSSTPLLDRLPCPQLRQLQLENVRLQLEAAGSSPGLLHDCTGLTALDLKRCQVQDPWAAFAATAALPELQHLRWFWVWDAEECGFFAELQHPAKLTYLSLDCGGWYEYEDEQQPSFPEFDDPLRQLSALANLEHLDLTQIPDSGVPGGLPSQLSKLTFLQVGYDDAPDVAEQLQHLSTLTALKGFSFKGSDSAEDGGADLAHELSGIGHLQQLTSLELSADLQFSISSTRNWACLTALESLSLWWVKVQPQALAALTQLQALSVGSVDALDASYEQLFAAVAQLTLLTELTVDFASMGYLSNRPSPTAFTALTASTNLCSLQLSGSVMFGQGRTWAELVGILPGCIFMEPERVYPRLRSINLGCALWDSSLPLSEQQLQVLCSCCPAVESLAVALEGKAPPTAYLPLLQLSALTHLEMQQQLLYTAGSTAAVPAVAAAAAAAVGVAAQLSGLKQLALWGLPSHTDPLLMQLTVLQSLEKLTLHAVNSTGRGYILDGPEFKLQNKARRGNPPDLWLQLQSHLSA